MIPHMTKELYHAHKTLKMNFSEKEKEYEKSMKYSTSSCFNQTALDFKNVVYNVSP